MAYLFNNQFFHLHPTPSEAGENGVLQLEDIVGTGDRAVLEEGDIVLLNGGRGLLTVPGGLDRAAYVWGNERPSNEHPQANIWQGEFPHTNTLADGFLRTAPVKSFQPNGYGLYDMAGNVREWVADWYKPYPAAVYKSPDFGEKYKVVRGAGSGGQGHYALSLFQRTAYRGYLDPNASYTDVGFRCAK